jgi:DNA-binding NarL/FixJ family response regulator
MNDARPERAGARARVLLADDHADVLAQTASVLAGAFEIVGSVANGADLITAAARLDPDVVVLDITMPDMDGIEAARQLQHAGCRSKILFLTVHEDADYVRAALHAGGTAYVSKAHLASHLVIAIQEALAGRRFVSPIVGWDEAPAPPASGNTKGGPTTREEVTRRSLGSREPEGEHRWTRVK